MKGIGIGLNRIENFEFEIFISQVQTLLNCSPGAGMKTSCSAVQTESLDAAAARNQLTNQERLKQP